MYIDKYWGNYIGGSDDSLNLVAFLDAQKKKELPLSEIFTKIGLDKQNWDFRQTVEYLEFTDSHGEEMNFQFAIDVVLDLAAIVLECLFCGKVSLRTGAVLPAVRRSCRGAGCPSVRHHAKTAGAAGRPNRGPHRETDIPGHPGRPQ